jgi:hypothetical protein
MVTATAAEAEADDAKQKLAEEKRRWGEGGVLTKMTVCITIIAMMIMMGIMMAMMMSANFPTMQSP